jgi:hypothetical protein
VLLFPLLPLLLLRLRLMPAAAAPRVLCGNRAELISVWCYVSQLVQNVHAPGQGNK